MISSDERSVPEPSTWLFAIDADLATALLIVPGSRGRGASYGKVKFDVGVGTFEGEGNVDASVGEGCVDASNGDGYFGASVGEGCVGASVGEGCVGASIGEGPVGWVLFYVKLELVFGVILCSVWLKVEF